MLRDLDETNKRLYEKLYKDLGELISQVLQQKEVNEILLNPDGQLWIDHMNDGLLKVGEINRSQAYAVIHSLAGINNFIVSQHSPRLEAELPHYKTMKGERFTGQIPPLVAAPCFTIRKRAEVVFELDDYVNSERATGEQAIILKELVKDRKNILVCGGPGSGKTTVTNALIAEAVKHDSKQRFLILEDLPELQCKAVNSVAMLTTDQVNMTGLLKTAMRMRPDRILIGEVRGAEALDMLKAWNTGCPGGICTVHANGTSEAIQRILDLAIEAGLKVPPISLVLHTINAVVNVVRQGSKKGFIQEIVLLRGYKNEEFIFEKLC